MSITELREDLEELRAYVRAGNTEAAERKIEQALKELDGTRLLTTTEAASLLNIRSVNTLKLLCRRGDISYVTHGNRMMIPLSEIERVQESEAVRGIRASDQMHDATDGLGSPDGLSAAQMDDLEAARPGRIPWDE